MKKVPLFYDSVDKSYDDSLVSDFTEDMCRLYNSTDLVAMDKSENSSKTTQFKIINTKKTEISNEICTPKG